MQVPRDNSVEAMPALELEGYEFGRRRFERLGSDIFETRLMFERAFVMRGPEAASIFYEPDAFERSTPRPILRLLQGQGSVQTVEGDEHRDRKAMFMQALAPDGAAELVEGARNRWLESIGRWNDGRSIAVHEEAQTILCEAVCDWAGVELSPARAAATARDLALQFDGAGSLGLRYLRATGARYRCERWIGNQIRRIRSGQAQDSPSVIRTFALHRELEGELLTERVATAEVLSLLRPTVAVARWVEFIAHALFEHPELREQLRSDDEAILPFVQEVRRWYPFFPMLAGRAMRDVRWGDFVIPQGTLSFLDLFATNRDPTTWTDPDRFDVARFESAELTAFNLIPQGGGDRDFGHRCAGEWLTIELMKLATEILCREIDFEYPAQNSRLSLTRMPALAGAGMRIENVRQRERAASGSA